MNIDPINNELNAAIIGRQLLTEAEESRLKIGSINKYYEDLRAGLTEELPYVEIIKYGRTDY